VIGDIVGEKCQVGGKILELVDFFESNEKLVEGTFMTERAKKLGASLGWGYANFLISHEVRIPKEWREYDLVFPEALHEINNCRCILYLHYHGWYWSRGYGLVKFDWTPRARLVRLCR